MLAYNHEPHIANAIDGVIKQKTDFAYELIIGEDCSSDRTREIVFDYERRYPDVIRVITSNNNVGIKKNASRTLKACTGEYLAFCEGDDYWQRADKLQKQVDYIRSHPMCGLVYSDYDWQYVKSGVTIRNFLEKNGKIVDYLPQMEDIINKTVDIRTCTVLARKKLIEQIIAADPYLHESDNFKMGDTQMWAEISLISQIHFLKESLATYRILEESVTQSRNIINRLRFLVSDYEMYLYLCEKHNLPEWLKQKYLRKWCRHALQLAFYEHRPGLAESVVKKLDNLSVKESIWYMGIKHPGMRILISLFLFLRRMISAARHSWRTAPRFAQPKISAKL